MFEAFVVMLREGVEAALVIGIILVLLRRSGREQLVGSVYWGVALAVAASIAAAVALRYLPINGEVYEGVLYSASAAFVGTMIWWVHRNARRLRAQIEERVQQAAKPTAGRNTREAWGLGAFAFLMVFREGAEAVALLTAINLTTEAMLSFIGTLLGLVGAVVFGVMFVRGSLHVNLRRFFAVTEWILGIFVAQLIVNGYHEFSEAGLLPATQQSMAIIGPLVRHNALFILAIVALPLLVWVSGLKDIVSAPVGPTDAERRLALARARRERFYGFGAIASALIVLGTVGAIYARDIVPKTLPPPEPVHAQDGVVRIPFSAVEDGHLHRFGFATGNRTVRFLVLKTADGKLRTAFDMCEICGVFGYLQEGSQLVCLNCAAEINPATVGLPGGCNPVPLESATTSTDLIVSVPVLEKQAPQFPAWTQTALTAVDPVCGMLVNINEAAATEEIGGKTYYFCRERCREFFHEKHNERKP